MLVAAAPLLEAFPLAALAGLVVYAAIKLVDIPEIRRVLAFRTSEAMLMTAAFVGVVAFDLLIGIGIAIALSVADLLRRVARAHDAVQGSVPGLAGLHDVDDYPEATTLPGLVVYRYDAPLFFANAEDFRNRVLAAVAAEQAPVEWVLLNMEANVEVDLTAIDMLEELRTELGARDIVLALARVKQDALDLSGSCRPRRTNRRRPHLPHPAHRARGLPVADSAPTPRGPAARGLGRGAAPRTPTCVLQLVTLVPGSRACGQRRSLRTRRTMTSAQTEASMRRRSICEVWTKSSSWIPPPRVFLVQTW